MNRRNFLSLAALIALSVTAWGSQQQSGVVYIPAGWQGTLCIVAEPQVDGFPQKHCLRQSIQKQADGTVRIEVTLPKSASSYHIYATSRYGHKSSWMLKNGQITVVASKLK